MSLSLAAAQRLGHPILGVVIPAAIFAISFVLTWWLYRRFARGVSRNEGSDREGGSGQPERKGTK